MDGEDALLLAIETLDEELYEKLVKGDLTLAQFLEMKTSLSEWANRGAKLVGLAVTEEVPGTSNDTQTMQDRHETLPR